MLKKSLLVPAAVLALYLGGYAVARGTHVITHWSNYRHRDPQKRDSRHTVGSPCMKDPLVAAIHLFFTPLRSLEERYHNRVHSSGRCANPPSFPGITPEATAPKGAR